MLTAFTAGLILITISELGDKTFFIAVLLAMRHPPQLVFLGVATALAAMTGVSVLMGQIVALLPKAVIHYGGIGLFLILGTNLIYTASQMPHNQGEDVMEGAQLTLNTAQRDYQPINPFGIVCTSFLLTFVAEWGDRTQVATITLAAANDLYGVMVGAIIGHIICTLIAILCGRWCANRISEKMIHYIGGGLFWMFAFVAIAEGV